LLDFELGPARLSPRSKGWHAICNQVDQVHEVHEEAAKVQTNETDHREGDEHVESRENELVAMVLSATEHTEDEWELADLMEAWITEDEDPERLCPTMLCSVPSTHRPPSRREPALQESRRLEPEIRVRTEAA